MPDERLAHAGNAIVTDRHQNSSAARFRIGFTYFPGIDTSIMAFNREGWWSPSFGFYDQTIGPCGELYIHFGFAHRQEIVIDTVLPGYGPIFHRDTALFRVRERSGWYRLDTAARPFVQLARVWTPLGISYATHADKIYYALHTPDSMMAIWEMERCGRNKRQVTFPEEDPFTGLLEVEPVETAARESERVELWPVPARDGWVRLRFTAAVSGMYRLHVRDVLGRSMVTAQGVRGRCSGPLHNGACHSRSCARDELRGGPDAGWSFAARRDADRRTIGAMCMMSRGRETVDRGAWRRV